jgi:hypothetical protein
MAKNTVPKAAAKSGSKKDLAIADEFYRKGLGPGYPEEEFGPGDTARAKPEEPASLRNFRGDRYTRFDRPARNGNAPTRKQKPSS